MFKNVATQKIALFAFDTTTSLPKTGDSANITPYVAKDWGTVTVLGTATVTEMDAINAKGWYLCTLTQAETSADALLFTGKSSTANVSVVGSLVFTTPNRFSGMVIDAAGLADANAVKIGPTGAGTAQTARDLGASVLLSTGTGAGQLDFTLGVVKANAVQLLGTAWLTPGVAGTPDVNAKLHGGTAQTGRDIGASVLISSGTGAGQLDVTSGAIKIQTSSKKNQILSKFEFVMTDSTTHAPATGKTVSITRSIDGGAFGAGTLGAVTELSNGVYYTDIPAADMNGNVVTLRATASGADDLFITFTLEP